MSNTAQLAWDGFNRRAQDSLAQFTTILKIHTDEEMERYDKIIQDVSSVQKDLREMTNKIDDNDCASVNWHNDTQHQIKILTDSVNAWMNGNGEFIVAIKRAFPKDDEGKPDYDGHRTAHLSWISDAHEQREFKKFLKNTIVAALALGVGGFIIIASWITFLKGPIT